MLTFWLSNFGLRRR